MAFRLRHLAVLMALFSSTAPCFETASALPTWRPNVHYVEVSPAVPGSAATVSVIEFFWYSCGRCKAFEPYSSDWLRHKPADVVFTRVPVAFKGESSINDARLFYTLQLLQRADLHRTVFETIYRRQVQQALTPSPSSTQETDTEQMRLALRAMVIAHGVDAEAFDAAYRSEYVAQSVVAAIKIGRAHKITATPAIAIDGKYATDLGRVGDYGKLILLTDYLVDRSRNEKRPAAP